jgi:LacI family transcriptional regulator
MVAELFTALGRAQSVLMVTGDLSVVDHAEKLNGFRSFLENVQSPVKLAGVIEAHDDPDKARELTLQFLRANASPEAVYVSTANSLPVIHALTETGRLGQMTIITTDLFPALAPLIRDGKVFATMYQQPRSQGRMAFEALYQFLVQGTCPPLRRRIPPHLVLRSNLDLFLDMLPT